MLLANNVTADTPVNVTIRDLGPLINQTQIVVPVKRKLPDSLDPARVKLMQAA